MRARLPLIDSLRGFALLLMFGYHFAFDLSAERVCKIDFRALPWVVYRESVITAFFVLAGVGLSLSGRRHPPASQIVRLAAGAGAISLASYLLYHDAWVFFGVLHCILAVCLLCAPLTRFPRLCVPAGIAAVALPAFFRSPAFDGKAVQVLGLGTHLPHTIDFVPLLPWMGAALIGIFVGSRLPRGEAPWLALKCRPLDFLGRHSLILYVTHQAALLPLAWVIARVF